MTKKYFEIAGTGLTNFGELYDYSLEDLLFEATNLALDEAKTTLDQIDAVIIGNMIGGEVTTQSQIGAVFAENYNYHGPVIRVEAACASGGLAIYTALQGLKAGTYQNVLVVGVEKMTDFDTNTVSELLMQAASQEERDAGLSFPGLYALMTQAYMKKYGLERNVLSVAPVLMHKNAMSNPKAQFQKEITVEQVNKSSLVAEPLRLLDCSPITDGAAAVVIRTVEQTGFSKAYLLDSEIATDSIGLAKRENHYSINATKIASHKLLLRNNISTKQIGVVELHDCFSIAMLMALEDMGLAREGEAGKLVERIYYGDHALILNPSGGLKASGHPVGATGVKQLIEVAKCVDGRSSHKIPTDLKIGFTHNVGGSGGTCAMSVVCNHNYFK